MIVLEAWLFIWGLVFAGLGSLFGWQASKAYLRGQRDEAQSVLCQVLCVLAGAFGLFSFACLFLAFVGTSISLPSLAPPRAAVKQYASDH